MMLCKWFEKNKVWGTIPLRLIIGILFLISGIGKLSGLAGFRVALENWGFPIAGVFAIIVALVETIGGVALILGVLTRTFAILLSVVLVVAILVVHLGGGYEKALVMLAGTASLAFTGAGPLSIENKVCKHKKKK